MDLQYVKKQSIESRWKDLVKQDLPNSFFVYFFVEI